MPLEAIGNYVVVEPLPDTVEFGNFSFTVRGKVNKGILKSKGSGVQKEAMKEGCKVYYRAGAHRTVDKLYLMSIRSIVAYESAS